MKHLGAGIYLRDLTWYDVHECARPLWTQLFDSRAKGDLAAAYYHAARLCEILTDVKWPWLQRRKRKLIEWLLPAALEAAELAKQERDATVGDLTAKRQKAERTMDQVVWRMAGLSGKTNLELMRNLRVADIESYYRALCLQKIRDSRSAALSASASAGGLESLMKHYDEMESQIGDPSGAADDAPPQWLLDQIAAEQREYMVKR